jgi:hypothetical protein
VTYWDKSPDRHAVCATTSLIGVTGSASAALTLVNLDPGDLEAVTTAAVDTELDTEVGERRLGNTWIRGATEGLASLLGDGHRG